MGEHSSIDRSMTVDALMRTWPSTIGVVLEHRMHCVGCPIGIFHTITEACLIHALDERAFTRALSKAIDAERGRLRPPAAFGDQQ